MKTKNNPQEFPKLTPKKLTRIITQSLPAINLQYLSAVIPKKYVKKGYSEIASWSNQNEVEIPETYTEGEINIRNKRKIANKVKKYGTRSIGTNVQALKTFREFSCNVNPSLNSYMYIYR